MQKAIGYALKTWYDKDHPLHLEPLHPAFGLAGEAGELMDLWKKNEFKPEWSWWDCRYCKENEDWHSKNNSWCWPWQADKPELNTKYTPLIIDELGDLWYYLRILYYITKKSAQSQGVYRNFTIPQLLATMNYSASTTAYDVAVSQYLDVSQLHIVYSCLLATLEKLDYDLERLTESNWQKLKDGDNHGWLNARKSH